MDAKYLKKAFLSLKASLVAVISSPVFVNCNRFKILEEALLGKRNP